MPFSVFPVQIDDEAVFGLGALQVRIFFGHLLAQGGENLKVGIVAGDGHPLGVDDAFGQIFLSIENLADFLDGKSGLPQGLDPVCRKGWQRKETFSIIRVQDLSCHEP